MKRTGTLLACVLLVLSVMLSAQARALPYDDANAIRNTDAVAMLTDLCILEGDGSSFHPEATLTRGQVAKIAALILTDKPQPIAQAYYTDISNSWARDYISYCTEQGFLAGYTDGSFAPNAPVTAHELAKMLLGAIGYDLSDMEGRDWAERLDVLAESLNLYNGYDLNRDQPIIRDYAARLILNALNCQAVIGYENGEPVYLVDDLLNPVTVLEHRFGVLRYNQVVTANEYADLDNPGTALEDGYTKLYGHYAMDFSSQLSDLGRTVTIYLRDGQPVGVPVYDPTEFWITYSGSSSLNTLLENGYALASDVRIFDNCIPAGEDILTALADSDSVTLIDYESDGLIDLVLVFRWNLYPLIQQEPIILDTPAGNQIFAGLSAGEASELPALCLNGRWVIRTF